MTVDTTGPGGFRSTFSSTPAHVKAGGTLLIRLQAPKIVAPRLWSPRDPSLCSVQFRLYAENRVVDDAESPLGFRWHSFDAGKGFFLNGSPLKLRGTNRHDNYPGLGWALPV